MGTDQQTRPSGEEKLERANSSNLVKQEIGPGTSLAVGEISDLQGCEQPGPAFRRIPVQVDVAVPIRGFQVRDVLGLRAGQVVASGWIEGEDLPLAAHGTQLAWTEIEVIDQKLAMRITRLA